MAAGPLLERVAERADSAVKRTPSSGDELQHRIGERAERVRDEAKDRVRSAGAAVVHRYEDAAGQAQRLVNGARGSAEGYGHAVEAVREGVETYEREMSRNG